jgi:RHS repeat-associated protein
VKGLTVEFTYDAFSRRIGKKVSELSYGQPGAPTLVSWEAYVYDGWNMIGTYSRHLSGSTAGKGKERLATHVWGPDLGSRLEARRDWQAAGGVGGLLMTLYPMPSVNVPTYIEWLAGQGVYETTQIGYEDGNGGWVPYYGEYTGPFYDENNNWISEYGGYDSPYGFLTYSMATAYSLDYGYYAALYEVNHRLHVPVMDHMGNVTSVVRLLGSPGSGSSAQTEFLYDYDAFGKELRASALIAGSNPDSYPFRFSTKFTDPETGLIYYGYRFYDPANGRWPSRDPIGERGGVNLYGMVGNDAVNFVDVLGMIGGGNGIYLPGISPGLPGNPGWKPEPPDPNNPPIHTRTHEIDHDGEGVTVEVYECEIVLLYGHGFAGVPHKFDFKGKGCATGKGFFFGCEAHNTNNAIPDGNKLFPGENGPKGDWDNKKIQRELYDRRQEIDDIAKEMTKPPRCCKQVNIRHVQADYNPHEWDDYWSGRFDDFEEGWTNFDKTTYPGDRFIGQ